MASRAAGVSKGHHTKKEPGKAHKKDNVTMNRQKAKETAKSATLASRIGQKL